MTQIINNLFFSNEKVPGHLKVLDGLRGLAILIVLLSHSSNADIFLFNFLNFQKSGIIGVYLFFFLSAYLLDSQIIKAFLSNKTSKIYWKNYFLRRFLRIYPLFTFALLLYRLLTFLGLKMGIDSIGDIFAHLLLLKGDSIFWSIPPEFKFYILSPFLLWFFHRLFKFEKKRCSLFIFILIILSIILEIYVDLPLVSTIRYLPIFLTGMLLPILEINYSKSLRNKKLFEILGIISFLMIFLSIPFYFKHIFRFSINFPPSLLYFPYALFAGLILLSAKYGLGLIKYFLELKILRFFGIISFSMYLFHMIFLNILQRNIFVIPDNLKFFVFFLLTILFSTFSYLLIERPLSKIRMI